MIFVFTATNTECIIGKHTSCSFVITIRTILFVCTYENLIPSCV